MCYSLWYNAPTMLPASGRQHHGCPVLNVLREEFVTVGSNFIHYMYHTKSRSAPMGSAKQLQMMYRDLKTHLTCSVGMCQ